MSIFKELALTRQKEFMAHVRPEMEVLSKRKKKIEYEEFMNLRCNSYEQKLLQKNLSEDALVRVLEYYYGQSQFSELGEYELPRHYDEAITGELSPYLIRGRKT